MCKATFKFHVFTSIFMFMFSSKMVSIAQEDLSADSSSQHQSWWKWMLMPKPFYSNSGGSRRTSYSPTTQYPFTSSYQYPRGSMNGYFSSYQPYNRNPSNSYYTRKNSYGGYVRTPASTKPSIFSWQTTSLPIDTTTTMDKVEMMRTAGNLRATTTTTSTTTKISSTTRPIAIELGLNEVYNDKSENNDERIIQTLPEKLSEKISKMEKDFIPKIELTKTKSLSSLLGKKLKGNKRKILLDPSYLTGCTKKGLFPVSEDSSKVCSNRFMVCSKGKYGFRGNYFRCPLGYVFHWKSAQKNGRCQKASTISGCDLTNKFTEP